MGARQMLNSPKKRSEKTIADSDWHAAETNKERAIELEETTIKND